MAGTQETHTLLDGLVELLSSEPMSGFEFGSLLVRLDELRGTMLRFTETHGVILCPVSSGPAMTHGTSLERFPDFSYAFEFNLTGFRGP